MYLQTPMRKECQNPLILWLTTEPDTEPFSSAFQAHFSVLFGLSQTPKIGERGFSVNIAKPSGAGSNIFHPL